MAMTTFKGPVKSQGGFISGADSLISLTASTKTLNSDDNAGRTMLLDRAAGVTVTLPAALGTGNTYNFYVKTTTTSNGYIIKVANATDTINGRAYVFSDNAAAAVIGFVPVAGTDDTITLNGTTTGGYSGDMITVQDVAAGLFRVLVETKATGTEATPFSATVS